LIVGKIEQFVLDDRSTHAAAKLIPLRMGQRHTRVLIERVPRLRASEFLNQNALPWMSLVPDLVDATTKPAMDLPNSAS